METRRVIGGALLIVLALGVLHIMLPGTPSGIVLTNTEYQVAEDATGTSSENISERGAKFLNTKSTGEKGLGCGPPDDFDCGLNRYSGFMALTNIQAYEKTQDEKYLNYAIAFATTEQTSPPDWCLSCTCIPPDDFDCGMGEIQAEMTEVFARLYSLTGDERYLEYAERFAHTKPTAPPEGKLNTLCRAPDDFDCGQSHVQSGYIGAYESLHEATGDPKYMEYIGRLGDAWMNAKIEEKGPAIIGVFLRIYNLTGKKIYYDKAIELGNSIIRTCDQEGIEGREWGQEPFADYDETAYIVGLLTSYEATGEETYLECVNNLLKYTPQCQGRVCENMVQQANMILALTELFRTTGSTEYLNLAEEFARQENINSVESNFFGYTTSCENFDCEDAEDQAVIASALLELGEVKESVEARGETLG